VRTIQSSYKEVRSHEKESLTRVKATTKKLCHFFRPRRSVSRYGSNSASFQEEYIFENIRWTPIDYFNNAIVVELLEGKKPPGLFLILDDVCATLHAGSTVADVDLKKKLTRAAKQHAHFQDNSDGFAILHYAGVVSYSVDGFCDKNRDVLFLDLIELMQTSTNSLVRKLYPQENIGKIKTLKSRPITAGSKIRNQANRLVDQLTKCTPHYIRCIKPNETKKPRNWDHLRVKHQVEYLGLKENIRVRRAGFAYRRPFSKFLHRYAILTKETWPRWPGDEKQGIEWILGKFHIDRSQYQLGRTKLFIKAPEILFMLEEARDRNYNKHAQVIQKAFKKYFTHKRQEQQIQDAANLLFGRKERKRETLNRNFFGDYIGLEGKPQTMSLIGRREKVFFAEVVKKYNRRFQTCRVDLILTGKCIYLIGREQIKNDSKRSKSIEVIKRKLSFDQISCVSLSTLTDNFIIIHVKEDYASVLESIFKTEFLYVLSKKYLEDVGHPLNIIFNNDLQFKVKKEGWGGGGMRYIKFMQTVDNEDIIHNNKQILKPFSKILNVSIAPGLSNTTKPNNPMAYRWKSPISVDDILPPHQVCDLITSALSTQNNQTITTGTSPPMAVARSVMTPSATTSNGRPLISSNRPNVQSAQFRKDMKNGMNNANKLRDKQIAVRDMLINNPNAESRGLLKFPPPPTEPPPPNEFIGFRLPPPNDEYNSKVSDHLNKGMQTSQEWKQINNALERERKENNVAYAVANKKVPPPKPRQKPALPSLPKVKALYNYEPKDLDELGLKEGDIVEVLKKHEGGWWHGRLKGKTGLFPANYVEKI
ncbi:Myosin-Ie, partial [Cyphomyrmex costatus]